MQSLIETTASVGVERERVENSANEYSISVGCYARLPFPLCALWLIIHLIVTHARPSI